MSNLPKLISEKYNISEKKAIQLITTPDKDWLGRVEMSILLNLKAKQLDRLLDNLNVFNIELKKATTFGLQQNFVRFTESKKGNVKELFNFWKISQAFYTRKMKTKVKRKCRKNRQKNKNKKSTCAVTFNGL